MIQYIDFQLVKAYLPELFGETNKRWQIFKQKGEKFIHQMMCLQKNVLRRKEWLHCGYVSKFHKKTFKNPFFINLYYLYQVHTPQVNTT